MSGTVDFRLLGPIEAAANGTALPLGGARRRAVLAMLALDAGSVVSTGRLIEGVWDDPPETAATALQGHISQLRRLLGEDAIVTRAPGYLLDAAPTDVDAVRCEHALEQARGQLASGDAVAAAATLREAVTMWRGEPLADVADAPFAREALPALSELRVALEEERLECELALGRHVDAITALRELCARERLRERPRALLMLALYRADRQAEALDAYESWRLTLSEELGIEPSERLRALHESMLRQDPELGVRPRLALSAESRRRRPWILAVAGLGFVAVGIAVSAGGGGSSKPPARVANGVVRIGPDGRRLAASRLDGTPTSVAAGNGRAWVLDADGQTVSEIDSRGRRQRTFATGATPTGITAGDDALWIAQGRATGTQFPGAQTTSVAHVDPRTGAVVRTIPLPAAHGPSLTAQHDRIAASRSAVWVLRSDGAVIRIDPRSDRVKKVLPLAATAVSSTPDAAWVLTADGSLVRIADADSSTGPPIDVGDTGGSSLAAGGGAVWVVDAPQGILQRFDDPSGARSDPVDVGVGAGAVAYGDGTVWVAQPSNGTVLRVDAGSGRIVGAVRLGATPQGLASDGSDLWTSVASAKTRAAACGPLEYPPGAAPEAILAADFPLQSNGRSPITPMIAAIKRALASRSYVAGSHHVGLLVCDDSTAQLGTSDPVKCMANARGYASDRRIVAVIGPYKSSCASAQIPVAAAAPGGPLAMVSPTATDPLLNRPGVGRPVGAFTRVVAADDRQAEAAVRFVRERGHHDVFVLDDGDRYGLSSASYFAYAARAAGMRVHRATWSSRQRFPAIARRVQRARSDLVWISGTLDNDAGQVVRSLRRALGPGVTIAGFEGLLPIGRLFDRAGAAAKGVLVVTGEQPARGRAHPFADLATQATLAALTAVSRSDGSRRSVARALRTLPQFDANGDLRDAPVTILRAAHPGGSRQNMSPQGAQVVTVVR